MYKIILLFKVIFRIPFRFFTKISPLALIKNSKIHKLSAICAGSKIYDCKIDRYSYVGKKTTICNCVIGSFCSIANECIINLGSHPLDMVSTSPVFYSRNNILKQSFNVKDFNEFDQVIIGNDVWIGTRAFIRGGITIGDGAIVGAYSVVTKDISPYTIVAGNPAKVIGNRFDDHIVNKLLKIKWWNWDIKNLKDNAEHFEDASQFIKMSK